MLLLAATALEKMQAVPTKVWINLALGVLIFFAIIIVIRKAAEMNKALLVVIIFVVCSSVGLNWIYYRNEPKFLTSFVDKISNFLPTAATKAKKEKPLPGV